MRLRLEGHRLRLMACLRLLLHLIHLFGILCILVQLRHAVHEPIDAVLQIDTLLRFLVPFLLRLLDLLFHHFQDSRVLLQIADGFLRLNLAVFGRVGQPSDIILEFAIVGLKLLHEFITLPLYFLSLFQLLQLPQVLLFEALKQFFLG